MTFLDRLKRTARQLAQGASGGAEILRLQAHMGALETEMERVYARAGRRARELRRRRLLQDPDLELLMARIDELEDELQEARRRVQALRQRTFGQAPEASEPAARAAGQTACPQCGHPVRADARYCQQCGSKLLAG